MSRSDRPDHRNGRAAGVGGAGRVVAELDAERAGWYELAALVRSLRLHEQLEPGYYRRPDWSVRDLVGHVGTWLAEAEIQLERMSSGTYQGHEVDIDALNALFLTAMRNQPWSVAWIQANAGRTRMLQEWANLFDRGPEGVWWIRKAGADHYAHHLPRLRAWVAELTARRAVLPFEGPARAALGDVPREFVTNLRSANDRLDEASRESFPASDPPQWSTGGTIGGSAPRDQGESERQ